MATGTRESSRVGPTALRFLVEGDESAGSVAMFEFDIPAGRGVPIAHSHDGYEETIYGVEGALTWTVDGTAIDVGPGEALCIRRGAVHSFGNAGEVRRESARGRHARRPWAGLLPRARSSCCCGGRRPAGPGRDRGGHAPPLLYPAAGSRVLRCFIVAALALTGLAAAQSVAQERVVVGRSVRGSGDRLQRGDPAGPVTLVVGVIHGSEPAGLAVVSRLRRMRLPERPPLARPDGDRGRARGGGRGRTRAGSTCATGHRPGCRRGALGRLLLRASSALGAREPGDARVDPPHQACADDLVPPAARRGLRLGPARRRVEALRAPQRASVPTPSGATGSGHALGADALPARDRLRRRVSRRADSRGHGQAQRGRRAGACAPASRPRPRLSIVAQAPSRSGRRPWEPSRSSPRPQAGRPAPLVLCRRADALSRIARHDRDAARRRRPDRRAALRRRGSRGRADRPGRRDAVCPGARPPPCRSRRARAEAPASRACAGRMEFGNYMCSAFAASSPRAGRRRSDPGMLRLDGTSGARVPARARVRAAAPPPLGSLRPALDLNGRDGAPA